MISKYSAGIIYTVIGIIMAHWHTLQFLRSSCLCQHVRRGLGHLRFQIVGLVHYKRGRKEESCDTWHVNCQSLGGQDRCGECPPNMPLLEWFSLQGNISTSFSHPAIFGGVKSLFTQDTVNSRVLYAAHCARL